MQSHIAHICTIFRQSEFLNVLSHSLPEPHIFCQNEFSNVFSHYLPEHFSLE